MASAAHTLLSASVAELQAHVAAIEAAPTSEAAFRSIVASHKSSLAVVEKIVLSITAGESVRGYRKQLSESRCVSNLKTLGSDKSEFKNWNEKLINAVSQSLGTPWRLFMKNLNRRLDQDRKVLSLEEVNSVDGATSIFNADSSSEDLYYVLVEKTEGDAALRVNSGEPGDGLQAYMRVYLWFAGTTGLALTEKTRMLMHPTPVKHEHEIADALEKWAEQERTLRAHGDDYKLNAAFKVTALRVLMTCKREQFEFLEREARTKHSDKICDDMFDELYSKVREYAQQRRLEESMRKAKGDPMDVSQLQQQWLHDHEASYSEHQHESYLDALGSGKGKGPFKGKGPMKGKGRGPCYTCGESGHLAYECPSAKGKGKPGGKAGPVCYHCGTPGHTWWNCPQWNSQHPESTQGYLPFKGKGKLPFKGKGKAAYGVESSTAQEQWQSYQEERPSHEQQGLSDQGFGGGEISEVQLWQVPVSNARSNRDMRPSKTTRASNRFAVLAGLSDSEEETVHESSAPSGESLQCVHSSLPNSKSSHCVSVYSKLLRRVSESPRWVKKLPPVPEEPSHEIGLVGRNTAPEIREICTVSGEWERIPIKIDSGAIDTVMPPSVGRHFNVVETEMSQKGPGFKAANGTPIKHLGQRIIKGVGDQFQMLSVTAQVAEVKSTLGSVYQMLRAGNRVHFEEGNCYIEHIRTGKRTVVLEKNGTFEVGIWVPKASPMPVQQLSVPREQQSQQNRVAITATQQGFRRQDERD